MIYEERMNILIPIAGKGQRFAEAGYKTLKPFIPIPPHDIPMLQGVIINLLDKRIDQKFVFVGRNFTSETKRLISKWTGGKPCSFVDVEDKPQFGQAYSCLEAADEIGNETPLLIANADQLVGERHWQQNFYDFINAWRPDGCITLFPNSHPKWSYAQISNGQIVRTAEKEVISDMATCGHYYFKHGSTFVDLAAQAFQEQEKVNGEFYVCPLYNRLILAGGKVLPYLVNNFIGLGTPEDLNKYQSSYSRYEIFNAV